MKKKIKNVIIVYDDGEIDVKKDFEHKDGRVILRNGGDKHPPLPPNG